MLAMNTTDEDGLFVQHSELLHKKLTLWVQLSSQEVSVS